MKIAKVSKFHNFKKTFVSLTNTSLIFSVSLNDVNPVEQLIFLYLSKFLLIEKRYKNILTFDLF